MRNILAGLSGTSGMIAAGGVCLALVAAGYWVSTNRAQAPAVQEVAAVQPDDTEEEAAPTVAAETDVVEETAPAVAAETDVVEEAAPAPLPANPSFDEVRREADGVTVIAGQGVPGADVWVLQNGTEVAQAKVDASGAFAMIALIPPDGEAHVLTLLQRAEGGEQASDGEIILAPLAAPVETAEVAPTEDAAQEEVAQEDTAQDTASAAIEDATVVAETASEDTAAVEETAAVAATETAPAEVATVPEVSQDAQTAEAETETVTAQDDAVTVTSVTQEESVAVADAAPKPDTQTPAQEPESTAVAVLKSTAEGVELLNTKPPEVMDNVALDTISYSDGGDVELAGRAQSEASAVRVYLDNDSVVDLPVDEQGRWRGELPNVDEGVYTLRVDEVAEDGKVTSRVETPFKREAPEVLAAAVEGQDGPIKAITVQQGATLWAIARERYGDGQLYVRVFEANRAAIRNPDLIYPGQIFDLPD